MGEWIERGRAEWYAHVRRMPEDRLVKKVMTNKPVGIRSRGYPKKRWYETFWKKQSYRFKNKKKNLVILATEDRAPHNTSTFSC